MKETKFVQGENLEIWMKYFVVSEFSKRPKTKS